ncbi:transporter substrate-binding domain-containing protein [Allochromatium palmeri]|uniref:transporter substrate-binding domain-containing protein n=1 Tax=Allochromatium palmeri TaxID=231048 RepID=UPI001FE954BD|nr:transporter substrate-binding domain-containing protein [Allochromatium palmeri]
MSTGGRPGLDACGTGAGGETAQAGLRAISALKQERQFARAVRPRIRTLGIPALKSGKDVKRKLWLWLLLWFIPLVGTQPAAFESPVLAQETHAQAPIDPRPAETDSRPRISLIIATRQAPPFAFKDHNGQWTGIAIALWNRIAEHNGFKFHYIELGLSEMLAAVADGRVDAAVAALTITPEREQLLDFSHPFHSSGLAMALPIRGSYLFSLLARLISPQFLMVVAGLLALLISVGVLMWLAERRTNAQFRQEPLSGIGAGLWWSAVTMTTVGYGDKAPTTLLGRVIGMLWMFGGLILISAFTAAITTALTVKELDASISSIDDLRSQRVLALNGSTGEQFLSDQGIGHHSITRLTEALKAVAAGRAAAVVHDAPILRYEIKAGFAGQLRVLPLDLQKQTYGIALPPGSPLREPINVTLIGIIQSDDWNALLNTYLGALY